MTLHRFHARIRFIFSYARDLDATRRFYTDLLGMKEKGFNAEHGWLTYETDGAELMFFRPDGEIAVCDGWASQPGYPGGELETLSLAIEVPHEDFQTVVDRLKGGGAPTFSGEPEWRQDSYWGFTVRDPVGMTIEVYATPPKGNESPC